MKHLFLLLITILFFAGSAKAQDIKFGEVSLEELQRTECSYVPNAKAELLLSEGSLSISKRGVVYYVRKRFKVYKSAGKKYANVKIRLYGADGSPYEVIRNLRGFCYNFENGKIVKTKLDVDDRHGKRLNDYYNELSFVIPNVKVGSVFEFSYRKESQYLRQITPWQLQYQIPIALNTFEYAISNAYSYNVYLTGNVADAEANADSLGYQSKTGLIKSEICYPIYPEPYQPNMGDVYGKINFQFVKNNIAQNDSSAYNLLNKNLLEADWFGKWLNKTGVLKALSLKKIVPDIDFAKDILKQVRSKISWNGITNMYSTKYGIESIKNGKGSVADINLTYVRALNEAGFTAAPVLVSTTGNGKPHPVFADVNRFNYVVAAVKFFEDWIIVDATSKLPFGEIPLKLLNGNGYIIDETDNGWYNLNNNRNSNISVFVKADLNKDVYTENVLMKYSKYAAYPFISYIKENGVENFKNYFTTTFENEISNITISEADYENPLTIQFITTEQIEDKDILYIDPVKYGGLKKNPFEREVRYSPLDFAYTTSIKTAFNINFNNEWLIELPQKHKLILKDNKATFNYLTSTTNNNANIVSNYVRNEITFPVNDYLVVKDFFEGMTNLNNEIITLQRK